MYPRQLTQGSIHRTLSLERHVQSFVKDQWSKWKKDEGSINKAKAQDKLNLESRPHPPRGSIRTALDLIQQEMPGTESLNESRLSGSLAKCKTKGVDQFRAVLDSDYDLYWERAIKQAEEGIRGQEQGRQDDTSEDGAGEDKELATFTVTLRQALRVGVNAHVIVDAFTEAQKAITTMIQEVSFLARKCTLLVGVFYFEREGSRNIDFR